MTEVTRQTNDTVTTADPTSEQHKTEHNPIDTCGNKQVKTMVTQGTQTTMITLTPLTSLEVIDELNSEQISRELKYASNCGIHQAHFIDNTKSSEDNFESPKSTALKQIFVKQLTGCCDELINNKNSQSHSISLTMQEMSTTNDELLKSLATAQDLIAKLRTTSHTRAATVPDLDISTTDFNTTSTSRSDKSLFSPTMSGDDHDIPVSNTNFDFYHKLPNRMNFFAH